MNEENVLPIGNALLPGNVRRCSYCEREIVRVATGVDYCLIHGRRELVIPEAT